MMTLNNNAPSALNRLQIIQKGLIEHLVQVLPIMNQLHHLQVEAINSALIPTAVDFAAIHEATKRAAVKLFFLDDHTVPKTYAYGDPLVDSLIAEWIREIRGSD